MYKSGKLTKDDIESIIQGVESPEDPGEEMAPGEEEPTEEELFAQQIDQTNDLFVKFSIYDKINELTDKLNYFKDNFEDIQSSTYERVIQLREFLNILSNLVFNIETSVSYQMYGSILLQLTEIFTEYNANLSKDTIQDIHKEKELEDYRDGDKTADPVEQWADENKSHDMPDESTNV